MTARRPKYAEVEVDPWRPAPDDVEGWRGCARMADAREHAGVPLSQRDRDALARFPDRNDLGHLGAP